MNSYFEDKKSKQISRYRGTMSLLNLKSSSTQGGQSSNTNRLTYHSKRTSDLLLPMTRNKSIEEFSKWSHMHQQAQSQASDLPTQTLYDKKDCLKNTSSQSFLKLNSLQPFIQSEKGFPPSQCSNPLRNYQKNSLLHSKGQNSQLKITLTQNNNTNSSFKINYGNLNTHFNANTMKMLKNNGLKSKTGLNSIQIHNSVARAGSLHTNPNLNNPKNGVSNIDAKKNTKSISHSFNTLNSGFVSNTGNNTNTMSTLNANTISTSANNLNSGNSVSENANNGSCLMELNQITRFTKLEDYRKMDSILSQLHSKIQSSAGSTVYKKNPCRYKRRIQINSQHKHNKSFIL
jgi:hypothetical protein